MAKAFEAFKSPYGPGRRHSGGALPALPAMVLISDFTGADVDSGWSRKTLQGTGAEISRVVDPADPENFVAQYVAGLANGSTVGKGHHTFNPPAIIPEGGSFVLEAKVYLPSASAGSFPNLKLFDIENNTPPAPAENPGIRIMLGALGGGAWGLRVERSKIGKSTVDQTNLAKGIQEDVWSTVRIEGRAGGTGSATPGHLTMTIDGVVVYDGDLETILTQADWDAIPLTGRITPCITSMQVGATASSSTTATATVLMDDCRWHSDASGLVPVVYWIVGAGSPPTFLRNPVNVPAGTTRLLGRAKILMPVAPGAAFALFGQSADAWRFQIGTDRQITVAAYDSANAQVLGVTTVLDSLGAPVVLPVSEWVSIIFDVDHTAHTVTVTVDGIAHPAIPFTASGTGTQKASTATAIGSATYGGATLWPAGTQVADVVIERNGAVYKAIPNIIAQVNADAWKQGAAAV